MEPEPRLSLSLTDVRRPGTSLPEGPAQHVREDGAWGEGGQGTWHGASHQRVPPGPQHSPALEEQSSGQSGTSQTPLPRARVLTSLCPVCCDQHPGTTGSPGNPTQ